MAVSVEAMIQATAILRAGQASPIRDTDTHFDHDMRALEAALLFIGNIKTVERGLTIRRTSHSAETLAAGISDEWLVEVDNDERPHSTGHRTIDEALLMAGIIMRQIERGDR